MNINIYTDGACRSNGSINNIGAWGYLITYVSPDKVVVDYQDYEAVTGTTNNKMELTAVLNALKRLSNLGLLLNTENYIKIHTDSNYVVGVCTSWMYSWNKNNWIKSDGNIVLNQDIIKQLYQILSTHKNIKFVKVKAHSGDSNNELVDKFCNDAMDNLIRMNQNNK